MKKQLEMVHATKNLLHNFSIKY